jgi:hypothetical protein
MSCTFLKKYATPIGFWNELPFKEACKRFYVWVALFLRKVQLHELHISQKNVQLSWYGLHFSQEICNCNRFLLRVYTFLKKWKSVAVVLFSKNVHLWPISAPSCTLLKNMQVSSCFDTRCTFFFKKCATPKFNWFYVCTLSNFFYVIQRVFHRLAQGTLANSMCNSSTNRNDPVFLV